MNEVLGFGGMQTELRILLREIPGEFKDLLIPAVGIAEAGGSGIPSVNKPVNLSRK